MPIGAHTLARRGRCVDWLTPPEIISALGEFDLDPCCPANMPWRTAATMLTERENGLMCPWHGRVWLNPPYGDQTREWLDRLVLHGNGIALIFARTETKFFFDRVWGKASSVFFFRGRLDFYRPDGSKLRNAGGPSCLVAYGRGNTESIRLASELRRIDGHLVELHER